MEKASASGSGKSTLSKLFMRHWDPNKGSIFLDKENLKDIKEVAIRKTEGVMEQSTFIFDDTIANNIAFFHPKVDQIEIEKAAKKACLHEWIVSLPEQYNTKIGGRNRCVSDGEKQRIGLARLFFHDAPLILLDEPTSNLDYLNEQRILHVLKVNLSSKTVVLISHRETTLSISNVKYEMYNGKLLKQ